MPHSNSRRRALFTALTLAALASPATAENFTTAAEVRPILDATRASWIAVREYDGRDLIYFTHLFAWRCGLSAVHYGLNGAEPETAVKLEACHEDSATPGEIRETELIDISEAPGSVKSVTVKITYDDGSEDRQSFERRAVLIP
jgi:hypothetical protein